MAALGQSYTGSAAYVYDAGYGTVAGAAGVATSTTIPTEVGQVTLTGGAATGRPFCFRNPVLQTILASVFAAWWVPTIRLTQRPCMRPALRAVGEIT